MHIIYFNCSQHAMLSICFYTLLSLQKTYLTYVRDIKTIPRPGTRILPCRDRAPWDQPRDVRSRADQMNWSIISQYACTLYMIWYTVHIRPSTINIFANCISHGMGFEIMYMYTCIQLISSQILSIDHIILYIGSIYLVTSAGNFMTWKSLTIYTYHLRMYKLALHNFLFTMWTSPTGFPEKCSNLYIDSDSPTFVLRVCTLATVLSDKHWSCATCEGKAV